ncbi:translation initiation factor IF-2-like [Ursus maritimus]|uniref:Translation initiation factor IF-2-like n=1 Tax=Ursus maritimus TaxID=29073 RepID=A0A8M1H594_URSMA|nr:translation initiation factor IF-2-like [Ursus maritimus]
MGAEPLVDSQGRPAHTPGSGNPSSLRAPGGRDPGRPLAGAGERRRGRGRPPSEREAAGGIRTRGGRGVGGSESRRRGSPGGVGSGSCQTRNRKLRPRGGGASSRPLEPPVSALVPRTRPQRATPRKEAGTGRPARPPGRALALTQPRETPPRPAAPGAAAPESAAWTPDPQTRVGGRSGLCAHPRRACQGPPHPAPGGHSRPPWPGGGRGTAGPPACTPPQAGFRPGRKEQEFGMFWNQPSISREDSRPLPFPLGRRVRERDVICV